MVEIVFISFFIISTHYDFNKMPNIVSKQSHPQKTHSNQYFSFHVSIKRVGAKNSEKCVRGMNWICKSITNILIGILDTIETVKDFWVFVKEAKEELKAMQGDYPDVLKDAVYGLHKFIQLPGVKLHYVENGSKNKELLLLLHGFPDFWFTWKNQIKEFSKEHWVVAIDMRGYGESEKSKKTSFYKINLLVDDIKNLVLELGREKFTLIAHDWGGVIAHYFLRLYPDMLNQYILMNTVFHPKLKGCIYKNLKQFFKSWYILFMQMPYLPEFFFISKDLKRITRLFETSLTPNEIEAYRYTFGTYDKIQGPINYYRANFRNWKRETVPTPEKLNRYEVPGLYIHGENDLALTLNISFKKSFKKVKNVSCVIVPDGDHFMHIHKSEEINKIIRTFLESNLKFTSYL